MQRRRRPLRALLLSAGAAACVEAAQAGTLNQHYLSAEVGQSTATEIEETFDESVSFVDEDYQNGVPGTNPNARALFASADSTNGVLLTSGITVALQVPNKGRALAKLEERMFLDGDGPVVIDAQLALGGGGSGGFSQLDSSLQVGDCIAGVRREVGTGAPPFFSSNDCDDTAAVDWEVSGGAGLIRIIATFANEPSAIDIGAWVSGDFGGTVSDISDGEFTNTGALSIGVEGSTETYASPSFLTAPEPGHATLLCVGALAMLGARRRRRTR
jgi:hypothetical protein